MAEFFQAVAGVAALVAEALAGDKDAAVLVNSPRELLEESSANGFGKAGAARNIPAQHGLAVYFVHILTAGAGTANEGKFKFAQGYLKLVVDG